MSYVIYGAGGHARVLLDLIGALHGKEQVRRFFQDGQAPEACCGIPVSPYDPQLDTGAEMLLGIGNPKVRKILADKVKHPWGVLIHPKAVVAEDVEIGPGTVVLAGAVIQTGARIGAHSIINANVTVDHDALVGDFVTTYPGVYIGAESIIAEGTLIHPNAVVMRSAKTKPGEGIEPFQVLMN